MTLLFCVESLSEGRRADYDDAVQLVYAEVPEELDCLMNSAEDQDLGVSDEDELDLRRKINGDVALQNAPGKKTYEWRRRHYHYHQYQTHLHQQGNDHDWRVEILPLTYQTFFHHTL